MSFWILLWIVLSLCVLGFVFWTLSILIRQKKTWKAFAAKHKMRFITGGFMETPALEGRFAGYTFSLFACEHDASDGRTKRKLTAMEVTLKSELPFNGALASRGMLAIIDALNYTQSYQPSEEDWHKYDAAIRGHDQKSLEHYFTEERIKALYSLMKVKNGWVFFIFQDGTAILRIDLPDALENPVRLEKLAKRMVKIANLLELEDGERDRLIKGRGAEKDLVLSAPDALGDIALSLEDDD